MQRCKSNSVQQIKLPCRYTLECSQNKRKDLGQCKGIFIRIFCCYSYNKSSCALLPVFSSDMTMPAMLLRASLTQEGLMWVCSTALSKKSKQALTSETRREKSRLQYTPGSTEGKHEGDLGHWTFRILRQNPWPCELCPKAAEHFTPKIKVLWSPKHFIF